MRWLELIVAVLLTAMLAACGGRAPPPAPPPPPAYGARLEAPPPLAMVTNNRETAEFVIGLPVGPTHNVAIKLATALAIALQDHGITATLAEMPGRKHIGATVATRDAGDNIQIDVTWTVRDAHGTAIGGNEQRITGRPQDWAEGSDRLLSRIAIQAAFRIARQLGRGDVANVPIAALPDVLGPGSLMPPPGTEGPPAPPGLPASPSPSTDPAAPPAPATAPPPVAAAASKAPRVFVAAVSGPGSGAMTSAMRRALGESQMVLTNGAEAGGYQVQGSVEVSPPTEGRQRIVIRWVVKRSDGTQIGDLEQANAVRAGSLEGNWDRLAPIVALAAVESVVDLINRDRGGGGN